MTAASSARQSLWGSCAAAWDLIPHCRPGVPLRWLLAVAMIVLLLLVVVFCLAVGTSYLYAWSLEAGR
jgi:hypothetical protein